MTELDAQISAMIAKRDKLRRLILRHVHDREAYSVDIAEALGASLRETRSALSWLRTHGYVVARFEPAAASKGRPRSQLLQSHGQDLGGLVRADRYMLALVLACVATAAAMVMR